MLESFHIREKKWCIEAYDKYTLKISQMPYSEDILRISGVFRVFMFWGIFPQKNSGEQYLGMGINFFL